MTVIPLPWRGDTLAFSRDPLRITMFTLLIVTVSRVHQHYPILARLRPGLALVAIAGAYAWLHRKALTRDRVLQRWPMRRVLLLGVLSCGSAVFGISLGRSASFILESYSKTIICALLIALSIRQARDLYSLVWGYVISCGILAFFALFVFGMAKASNSYVTRLNDLYTYDSNDLGVVLMVGIALTLLLLVVARGMRRWTLIVILLALAATIARSGSRGAFVGFVVLGVSALLMADNVSAGRRLLMASLVLAALVIGSPPGYWKQMSTVMSPKEDYNYSSRDGRRALMKRGFGYMKEYPVFGLGINNFSRAECTISSKVQPGVQGPLRCTPPHNSYVQAGAELGVPGLFTWVSLIVSGIVTVRRLRRRMPRAWRRGSEVERFLYAGPRYFPLAMIGFAVTAFFLSFAWMDTLYILVALISGLYTAVSAQLAVSAPAIPARRATTAWRTRPATARIRVAT